LSDIGAEIEAALWHRNVAEADMHRVAGTRAGAPPQCSPVKIDREHAESLRRRQQLAREVRRLANRIAEKKRIVGGWADRIAQKKLVQNAHVKKWASLADGSPGQLPLLERYFKSMCSSFLAEASQWREATELDMDRLTDWSETIGVATVKLSTSPLRCSSSFSRQET
jgi:hypothetical protein